MVNRVAEGYNPEGIADYRSRLLIQLFSNVCKKFFLKFLNRFFRQKSEKKVGTSFIIKILRLDGKMIPNQPVRFLYRIVMSSSDTFFDWNELTAEKLNQADQKSERNKLKKHIDDIYSRNKTSYAFTG